MLGNIFADIQKTEENLPKVVHQSQSEVQQVGEYKITVPS